MKLPGEEQWFLGFCKKQVGTRSYLVECQGQQYRRNRRQLRTALTEEYLPNDCETEAPEEIFEEDEGCEMPEITVNGSQSPSDTQQMSEIHPTTNSMPGAQPPAKVSSRGQVIKQPKRYIEEMN